MMVRIAKDAPPGDYEKARAMMAETAKQRRLVWYYRLAKDVIATLGHEAGTYWLRVHRAALKRNLAAVQREWNEEKRRLRPADSAEETK